MNGLDSFGFGQPWWLLLLPALVVWFLCRGRGDTSAALTHSSTALLAFLGQKRPNRPGRFLRAARFAALTLLILALARPHLPQGERRDPDKGIDIMLACDVSGSMDEKDFSVGNKKITRREALLTAISEFVDARKNDRIGMVGFAKNTYLLSPLTMDGNWIKEVYRMVELQGGTAVGDGIKTAVDKLQENPKRSKVVILVTDGLNNSGTDPIQAGDYARKNGVRIYALEIMDLRKIRTAAATKSALNQIATRTGGQYFQASDTGSLMQIFRQIDRMEKREFEPNRNMLYQELFQRFVAVAGALLFFEWIAGATFWMRLP